MKKPDSTPLASVGGVTSLGEDKWVGKCVHVSEYLVTTQWEDGTPREPSALSLSVADGLCLVALNDKDLKQSIYTSAETFQEALKLMEAALGSGKASWRPWKAGKRK